MGPEHGIFHLPAVKRNGCLCHRTAGGPSKKFLEDRGRDLWVLGQSGGPGVAKVVRVARLRNLHPTSRFSEHIANGIVADGLTPPLGRIYFYSEGTLLVPGSRVSLEPRQDYPHARFEEGH